MTGPVRSIGSSGLGSRVRRMMVRGSLISIALMVRTAGVNSAGLFGTVGTRAKV